MPCTEVFSLVTLAKNVAAFLFLAFVALAAVSVATGMIAGFNDGYTAVRDPNPPALVSE